MKKIKEWFLHFVIYWLTVQKWLWKKVVFDNGIVGKNYHRYDHRILPYVQGMGNNGKYGKIDTAIDRQLKQTNRACT